MNKSLDDNSPLKKNNRETMGLKCAPEWVANIRIKKIKVNPMTTA